MLSAAVHGDNTADCTRFDTFDTLRILEYAAGEIQLVTIAVRDQRTFGICRTFCRNAARCGFRFQNNAPCKTTLNAAAVTVRKLTPLCVIGSGSCCAADDSARVENVSLR